MRTPEGQYGREAGMLGEAFTAARKIHEMDARLEKRTSGRVPLFPIKDSPATTVTFTQTEFRHNHPRNVDSIQFWEGTTPTTILTQHGDYRVRVNHNMVGDRAYYEGLGLTIEPDKHEYHDTLPSRGPHRIMATHTVFDLTSPESVKAADALDIDLTLVTPEELSMHMVTLHEGLGYQWPLVLHQPYHHDDPLSRKNAELFDNLVTHFATGQIEHVTRKETNGGLAIVRTKVGGNAMQEVRLEELAWEKSPQGITILTTDTYIYTPTSFDRYRMHSIAESTYQTVDRDDPRIADTVEAILESEETRTMQQSKMASGRFGVEHLKGLVRQ